MNLQFNWFFRHKPFGNTLKLELNNRDMYFMSEKATGRDWKRSSINTVRHCAGKEGTKYLKLD